MDVDLHSPTDLVVSFCDRTIKWGIVILMGFSPLPFGSVQPWAYMTVEIVFLVLFLAWIIKMTRLRVFWFAKLAMLIPVAIFIGVTLFQLTPLSSQFLSVLSPSTNDLYSWTRFDFPVEQFTAIQKFYNLKEVKNFPVTIYPHATISELTIITSYFLFFLVVINNLNSRKDVDFYLNVFILFGFIFSLFAMSLESLICGS